MITTDEHPYYGVQCMDCNEIGWYKDKTKANLQIWKPAVNEIQTPLGIIIGFGAFPHKCSGGIIKVRE